MRGFSLPADYYDPPEPTRQDHARYAAEDFSNALGFLEDALGYMDDAVYSADEARMLPPHIDLDAFATELEDFVVRAQKISINLKQLAENPHVD